MGGLALGPTGPPFGVNPLVPEAVITTEGFLPCSDPEAEPFGKPPVELFAAIPFTGEAVLGLPFCAGAEAPAAVGAVDAAVFVAVALAYERAGGCAGTAACGGDVVPEADEAALADCAALVEAEGGIALVIRRLVEGGSAVEWRSAILVVRATRQ